MKKGAKKLIKIGIVSSPWLGGSGVVAAELAKYLNKTGRYKIIFIGQKLPFRLSLSEVNFHDVSSLKHPLFENPLVDISMIEGIVEAVIEHKIDILHAHFALPFGYYAVQAKEILKQMGIKVKVITTLHGTDVLMLGKESPAIMKLVLKQSDEITVVSKNLMQLTKNIYRTTRNIRVIYNFIDHRKLPANKPSIQLRRRFARDDQKIFMHVSNFRPIKKVEDVLKIFSKVNRDLPSVLIFIGEGPKMNLVKRITNSMKCKDSIYFLEAVNNPYLYLQIADGLIITSKYESFCLAALEAMSFGVPVFSTNVGGIKEVIKHKVSGYLTKQGDIQAFVKNMLGHFSNNKKVAEMKLNSLNESMMFNTENIIPQYEKIYQKLLSQKNNLLKYTYGYFRDRDILR